MTRIEATNHCLQPCIPPICFKMSSVCGFLCRTLLITGSGEQRYCTPASLWFVFFYTFCIINVLLNFMYLFILADVFSRDYQTQQASS